MTKQRNAPLTSASLVFELTDALDKSPLDFLNFGAKDLEKIKNLFLPIVTPYFTKGEDKQ